MNYILLILFCPIKFRICLMKENDQLIKICQTIRRLREFKDITRDYMSSELAMTSSGYSKIERGEVDITLKKLFKIAEILNVKINQLFDFDINSVFNYKDTNLQSHNKKSKMIVTSNAYLYKYIKLLERENKRLKENKDSK